MHTIFHAAAPEKLLVANGLPSHANVAIATVPSKDLAKFLALAHTFKYSESLFSKNPLLNSSQQETFFTVLTATLPLMPDESLLALYPLTSERLEKIDHRLKTPLDAFIIADMRNLKGEQPHETLGWGLFAKKLIPRGTVLFFFSGEYLQDIAKSTVDGDYIQSAGVQDFIASQNVGGFCRFLQHLPTEEELLEQGLPPDEQEKIATANVLLYTLKIFNISIVVVEATCNIQPNEIIGYSYGSHFWLAHKKPPWLFYRSGAVFEGYVYRYTEKFFSRVYQEGLDYYNRKHYRNASLLLRHVHKFFETRHLEDPHNLALRWEVAKKGLACANSHYCLQEHRFAAIFYSDAMLHLQEFIIHADETWASETKKARGTLSQVAVQLNISLDRIPAETLLSMIIAAPEHLFFSVMAIGNLFKRKDHFSDIKQLTQLKEIWTRIEQTIHRLFEPEMPVFLLRAALKYVKYRNFGLSFIHFIHLETRTDFSSTERLTFLKILISCCQELGREDLMFLYEKKEKLLQYEKNAEDYFLEGNYLSAATYFSLARNFLIVELLPDELSDDTIMPWKTTIQTYYDQEANCYQHLAKNPPVILNKAKLMRSANSFFSPVPLTSNESTEKVSVACHDIEFIAQ